MPYSFLCYDAQLEVKLYDSVRFFVNVLLYYT